MIVLLFCCACGNAGSQTISTPIVESLKPPSRYLFVEYWTDVAAITLKKESCDNFAYIDGPGYSYEAKTLRSVFHVEFTESVSILGCGKQLNHPVGTGIFSNLYPISDFPYTPDWADFCQTLTIDNIDTSGIISAKVNDKTVSLAIGQEWTDSITDRSDPSCEKVTTYRLTNFGFIDANQIIMPEK